MLRLMRAARDEAMGDPYDLLVIGAGTAAIASSMRVRAAGWRTEPPVSEPIAAET